MAGLKLVMCIALISPALSQVFNGRQFQQRQQGFGMRQFGMGRGFGMGEMGEFMDTRSDMIADAMERRASMPQSLFRNGRLGSSQRLNSMNPNAMNPNVMNPNAQYNVYQGQQVQAGAQPYQIINPGPSNTVYLQTAPSGQYVSAPQMGISPQIIGAQQVVGNPQIMRAQQFVSNPQIMRAPQVVGNPQIMRAQQVVGNPQIMRAQQVVGNPQIMRAQQIMRTPQRMSSPQMVAAPQTGATQRIVAQRQVAVQKPVAALAPQPQANAATKPQSGPSVTTQTAGNIPADQVIQMLKQMFTTTGKHNNGVRKFVIV